MNFEGKRRYFVAYDRAACLNETNINRKFRKKVDKKHIHKVF